MNPNEIQRDTNEQEWNDAENWNGFWPFNLYFSKRDSRLWVPALFNSWFSPTTINLRHRFGILMAMICWIAFGGVIGWSIGHASSRQERELNAVHDGQLSAGDREQTKREQLKNTLDVYDPMERRGPSGIK